MAGGMLEPNEEDIKEIMAGAADLPLFRKDIEFCEKHSEEFFKQYPYQWVAIFDEKVVGVNADVVALMDDLVKKGIQSGRVVIRFIDPNPRPMILTAQGQT